MWNPGSQRGIPPKQSHTPPLPLGWTTRPPDPRVSTAPSIPYLYTLQG